MAAEEEREFRVHENQRKVGAGRRPLAALCVWTAGVWPPLPPLPCLRVAVTNADSGVAGLRGFCAGRSFR